MSRFSAYSILSMILMDFTLVCRRGSIGVSLICRLYLVMGSKISKGCGRRRCRTSRSGGTDSWSPYVYPKPPQAAYPQQNYYYTPQHPSYAPSPSYNYASQTPGRVHKTTERKYSRIDDNYQTLDQVSLLFCYSFEFLSVLFFCIG